MREKTVVSILRVLAKSRGSLRALAREIGISPAYLSDVLRGNRYPGPKIAKYLSLKRKVTWTRTARYEELLQR